MPSRIPRRCGNPQCRTVGIFDSGYCDPCKHERSAKKYAERKREGRVFNADDDRFRESVKMQNVFCQRVNNGVRCRRPSVIIHHLLEVASRPDLKYETANVVMVCQSCHPRPDDADQGVFVPTCSTIMGIVIQEDLGVFPGYLVTAAQEKQLWSRETQAKVLAEMSVPKC